MSDLDNTFKEKSKNLIIQPSSKAWKTLDKKLGRRNRRNRTNRYISPNSFLIAAIILGILAICVLFIYTSRVQRSTKSPSPQVQKITDSTGEHSKSTDTIIPSPLPNHTNK